MAVRNWIRRARGYVVASEQAEYTRRRYFADLSLVTEVTVDNAPYLLAQIVGRPRDIVEAYRDPALRSEYRIGRDDDDGRDFAWAARYLARVWLPKTPWSGPTFVERQPFVIDEHLLGSACPAPVCAANDEQWFFINGILTDAAIGRVNALRLSEVFHRRITMCANPTDGFVHDVHEAIRGRTLLQPSGPAVRFTRHIRAALETCARVVLICHSQGTIIAANVVGLLLEWNVELELLRKLELYMFGSATDRVPCHPYAPDVPFVEHYFNEFDLIAKIGPNYRGRRPLALRGRRFWRPGKWGHLLNHHYFDRFADGVYVGADDNEDERGRLLEFVGGRIPASEPG